MAKCDSESEFVMYALEILFEHFKHKTRSYKFYRYCLFSKKYKTLY